MRDANLARTGGFCSIAVGVSYIAVALFFVLDPTQAVHDPRELWPLLEETGWARVAQYWGYALGAVAAFGALPAIVELVRRHHEGWVRWTAGLAYLSFGVTAVETFRLVTATPKWADIYSGGDPTAQTAIASTDLVLRLDPATFLRFGALGPFFIVVSLLALRHGAFPKALAWTGVALGTLTITTMLGVSLGITPLVLVSAVLGGAIAAPVWFIWTGATLLAAARSAAESTVEREVAA